VWFGSRSRLVYLAINLGFFFCLYHLWYLGFRAGFVFLGFYAIILREFFFCKSNSGTRLFFCKRGWGPFCCWYSVFFGFFSGLGVTSARGCCGQFSVIYTFSGDLKSGYCWFFVVSKTGGIYLVFCGWFFGPILLVKSTFAYSAFFWSFFFTGFSDVVFSLAGVFRTLRLSSAPCDFL